MRRFIALIGAVGLSLLLSPSFAQTGLEEKVEEALSTLNYSEVTTGILYEKTPSYLSFDHLSGAYLSDSISLVKGAFVFAYGMLDRAHTTTSNMLPISDFWELADSLEKADTVSIALLHYRYNRFKPYSIDSNLIVYQDSHFYDVPGRPESPYMEDTIFVASLLRNVVDSTDIVFRLDSNLFFSNIVWGIQSLEIDFDDGNGWGAVSVNQVYNIQYPDTGIYRIKFRQVLNGNDTLWGQSLLKVEISVVENFIPLGSREYADQPDGYRFFPSAMVVLPLLRPHP